MLLGLALATLAGCGVFGSKAKRYEYGGMVFTGDAKRVRGDRASFVATGGPVSASLEGAIGATEYQGIRYCIKYLGTSDIDWAIGPDTPQAQLPVDGDKLTFQGTCRE